MNPAILLGGIWLVFIAGNVQSADWSYEGENGPPYWKDDYPICGDNSQSPIDIVVSSAVVDLSFGPITYSGYDSTSFTMTLKNTGHSVQADVSGGSITVTDAKLPGTYKLAQFHLHWGSVNTQGSEHLVSAKQYPMEIHFVHYDTKYNNINDAIDQPEGLAVVGVLVEIGAQNAAFQKIVDKLNSIPYNSNTTSLAAFALDGLIPSADSAFYRYSGSLTTPACYESVVWSVLKNTLVISQAQMDAFRSGLYEGSSSSSRIMGNNYRPVQALNGRTIYSSSANYVTWHVAVFLLPVLAFFVQNIC